MGQVNGLWLVHRLDWACKQAPQVKANVHDQSDLGTTCNAPPRPAPCCGYSMHSTLALCATFSAQGQSSIYCMWISTETQKALQAWQYKALQAIPLTPLYREQSCWLENGLDWCLLSHISKASYHYGSKHLWRKVHLLCQLPSSPSTRRTEICSTTNIIHSSPRSSRTLLTSLYIEWSISQLQWSWYNSPEPYNSSISMAFTSFHPHHNSVSLSYSNCKLMLQVKENSP